MVLDVIPRDSTLSTPGYVAGAPAANPGCPTLPAFGRHSEAVGELLALVAEHPLHERFYAQLMLALYRSERQSETMRAYEAVR